ncbi:MAG TPA: hypothetical protein VLK84_01355 [Longimicrobium sp.]|nr:hypothetical protein [Longimicrobium sp.]
MDEAAREALDHIVSALRPLLEQHGFRRAQAMDDQPAYGGTFRVVFAAGEEAVRFVWDSDGRYIVLEALEPESGGAWTDMLLKRIDLDHTTEAELAYLVEILEEELRVYFEQVGA